MSEQDNPDQQQYQLQVTKARIDEDVGNTLMKYVTDPNPEARQDFSRVFLTLLRQQPLEETLAHIDEYVSAVLVISEDKLPAVRISLLEQIPYIFVFCHEHDCPELRYHLYDRLLQIILQYLQDEDLEVKREAFQTLQNMFLGKCLIPIEQIEQQICPKIRSLFYNETQIEICIKTITVMSQMAPIIGGEKTKEMFLDRFLQLCFYQAENIRKTCVTVFPIMCYVLGTEVTETILLNHFAQLCKDTFWGIRKVCAESMPFMALICSLKCRKTKLTPLLLKLISDESKWVSNSALKILGEFISTFAQPCITGLAYNDDRDLRLINPMDPDFMEIASPELKENYAYYLKIFQENCSSNNSVSDTTTGTVNTNDSSASVANSSTNYALYSNRLSSGSNVMNSSYKNTSSGSISFSTINNNDDLNYSYESFAISNPKEIADVIITDINELIEVSQSNIKRNTCANLHEEWISFISEIQQQNDQQNEKQQQQRQQHYQDDLQYQQRQEQQYARQYQDQEQQQQQVNYHQQQQEQQPQIEQDTRFHRYLFHDSDRDNNSGELEEGENNFNDYNSLHYRNIRKGKRTDPPNDLSKIIKNVIESKDFNSKFGGKFCGKFKGNGTSENFKSTNTSLLSSLPMASPLEFYSNSESSSENTPVSNIIKNKDKLYNGTKYSNNNMDDNKTDNMEGMFSSVREQVVRKNFSDFKYWYVEPKQLLSIDAKVELEFEENIPWIQCGQNFYENGVVPQTLFQQYVKLVKERAHDEEINLSYAYHFPAVLLTVGKKCWKLMLLVLQHLCNAIEWKVRKTIAASFAVIPLILGKEITTEFLVPIYLELFKDLDEVKIEAIRNFANFFKIVDKKRHDEILSNIGQCLRVDDKHDNWRIKEELAKQIFLLIEMYEPINTQRKLLYFTGLVGLFLEDKISCVREIAADVLSSIIRISNENHREAIVNIFLVNRFALSDSWRKRQTFLNVIYKLITCNEPLIHLFRSVFDNVEILSNDKVPNIRILVAKILVQVIKLEPNVIECCNAVNAATNNTANNNLNNDVNYRILSALKKLQIDIDRDVSEISHTILLPLPSDNNSSIAACAVADDKIKLHPPPYYYNLDIMDKQLSLSLLSSSTSTTETETETSTPITSEKRNLSEIDTEDEDEEDEIITHHHYDSIDEQDQPQLLQHDSNKDKFVLDNDKDNNNDENHLSASFNFIKITTDNFEQQQQPNKNNTKEEEENWDDDDDNASFKSIDDDNNLPKKTANDGELCSSSNTTIKKTEEIMISTTPSSTMIFTTTSMANITPPNITITQETISTQTPITASRSPPVFTINSTLTDSPNETDT